MNHGEAYEALLGEGVRAEMLRAVLEATQQSASEDGEAAEDSTEPVASTSGTRPDQGDDVSMREANDDGSGAVPLSTASDNATFLSSRLVFTHDAAGQPVALDAEGNGVMMGWERPIMARTVERCCEPAWADRKGRTWDELVKEEDDEGNDREPLRVMNVGFGLGIVSLSGSSVFLSSSCATLVLLLCEIY